MSTEQLVRVIANALAVHGTQHNDDPPLLEISHYRPGALVVTSEDGSWQVFVERLRA
jgi:hypothetical protein